jgi:hypothetical protein
MRILTLQDFGNLLDNLPVGQNAELPGHWMTATDSRNYASKSGPLFCWHSLYHQTHKTPARCKIACKRSLMRSRYARACFFLIPKQPLLL